MNGHHSPIPWLLKSLDVTWLDFFLWALMKEMTYRTKVHKRKELLQHIIAAAAYIQKLLKMIQQAVNSCLKRARPCTENHGGHFKQL
jgi:hypothetical protein